MTDLSALREKVVESIKKDSLQQTFAVLFESIASSETFYANLIINNAHFQRIENAYQKHLIDWETMSRNRNQVIDGLLSLLDHLEATEKRYGDLTNSESAKFFSSSHAVYQSTMVSNENPNLQDLIDKIIIKFTKSCDKLNVEETLYLKKLISSSIEGFLVQRNHPIAILPNSALAGKLYSGTLNQPTSGPEHGKLYDLEGLKLEFNFETEKLIASINDLEDKFVYLEQLD